MIDMKCIDCPACNGTGKVQRGRNRPTLTPAQARVYAFVRKQVIEKRESPSYWEIARAVGLNSISTVNKHMVALREKGLISFPENGKRAARLIWQGEQ